MTARSSALRASSLPTVAARSAAGVGPEAAASISASSARCLVYSGLRLRRASLATAAGVMPFQAPGGTRMPSRLVFRVCRCVALGAGPKAPRVGSSAPRVAARCPVAVRSAVWKTANGDADGKVPFNGFSNQRSSPTRQWRTMNGGHDAERTARSGMQVAATVHAKARNV
jgi:hypothetical protein